MLVGDRVERAVDQRDDVIDNARFVAVLGEHGYDHTAACGW
jgi:hypothetical protein